MLSVQSHVGSLELSAVLANKPITTAQFARDQSYPERKMGAWLIPSITYAAVDTEPHKCLVLIRVGLRILFSLPFHHHVGEVTRTANLQAITACEEILSRKGLLQMQFSHTQ